MKETRGLLAAVYSAVALVGCSPVVECTQPNNDDNKALVEINYGLGGNYSILTLKAGERTIYRQEDSVGPTTGKVQDSVINSAHAYCGRGTIPGIAP